MRAWLKMVVTGKARSKIRSSMKEERQKARCILAEKRLKGKLKSMKADFEDKCGYMLVKYFQTQLTRRSLF